MRLLRFVSAACFLLLLPPLAAWGAMFPVLSGPQAYIGESKQENEAYTVLMILNKDQNFLLQERFVLPNGKISSWEIVGKWTQVRGGSFLQLSNASHFSRQINVGGTGNLYMGIQLPTGSLVTVPLRPQSIDDHEQDFRRLAAIDPSTLEAPSDQEQKSLAAKGGEEPALPVAVPLHLRKKQTPAAAVTTTSWNNGEELIQEWKNTSRPGRGTNAGLPEEPAVVVPVAGAEQAAPTLAAVEQPHQRVVLPVTSWQDSHMLASVPSKNSRNRPEAVPPARPEQLELKISLAAVQQPRQSVAQPAPFWKEEDLLSSVAESRQGRGLVAVVPVAKAEQAAPTPAAKEVGLLSSVVKSRTSRALVASVLVAKAEQAALSLAAKKQSRKSVLIPTQFWKNRYILSFVPQQRDT